LEFKLPYSILLFLEPRSQCLHHFGEGLAKPTKIKVYKLPLQAHGLACGMYLSHSSSNIIRDYIQIIDWGKETLLIWIITEIMWKNHKPVVVIDHGPNKFHQMIKEHFKWSGGFSGRGI